MFTFKFVQLNATLRKYIFIYRSREREIDSVCVTLNCSNIIIPMYVHPLILDYQTEYHRRTNGLISSMSTTYISRYTLYIYLFMLWVCVSECVCVFVLFQKNVKHVSSHQQSVTWIFIVICLIVIVTVVSFKPFGPYAVAHEMYSLVL